MRKWVIFWYEANEEVLGWIVIFLMCLGLALFVVFLKFWILICTLAIGAPCGIIAAYMKFKLNKEKRKSRRIY